MDTRIEWTERVWNPITGCTKVSTGCKHCYAEREAIRMQGNPNPKVAYRYRNGFAPTLQSDRLSEPLKWRQPRRVFVNSMSDLFHEAVPLAYIRDVFRVMEQTPRHTYQVLTKRADRLAELAPCLPWPANVWAGVSVETDRYLNRLDALRTVPAAVRFLSLEPLLGPLPDLNLEGIGWVIVGGESGYKARPMAPDWVIDIRDHCQAAGVPFFFKQWGGRNKKATGRELDGRLWDEIPHKENP